MTAAAQPSALVLAGASALGAYQAGVISYLTEDLAAALDGPVRFDVLSGTSAGAINAAALASHADDPAAGASRLVAEWTGLRLEQVLRPSAIELLSMFSDLTGGRLRALRRALVARGARGGLLDVRPLERLCTEATASDRIAAHLDAGLLRGIAVSATRVRTGRAVVFHQCACEQQPGGVGTTLIATRLAPVHTMASAAIPLLFPAVPIDGELYCDGGLRQMVPLSPAVHLGARRLLVVSPGGAAHAAAAPETPGPLAMASPLYLAGKALNALFGDSLEGDLDRLTKINLVLRAGARRYGPHFAAELDRDLAALGAPPLRPIDLLHIEPSRDLGEVAAAYVTGPRFAGQRRSGAAWVLRCLAGDEPRRAGDLLSYLLFDGGFAAELIALGRADARARHDELVAFLAGMTPLRPAEAAD